MECPSNLTPLTIAKAYALRDGQVYPNETIEQFSQRMYTYMGKLGWHSESDARWHHRLQEKASAILMKSEPNTTVGEIWEEARREQPRRLKNIRSDGVMAAIAEGMPTDEVYANFFTYHELIFLGW